MPIPPVGWGALESLIWDYKMWAEQYGHEFDIVNTKDPDEVVRQTTACQPDVIHVHCERYIRLLSRLEAKVKIVCSQWPAIYKEKQRQELIQYTAGDFYIACCTEGIREYLIELGVAPARLFIAKNGARADLYRMKETPLYPDRSIYLAIVCKRKRQRLFQDIDFIDFAGPIWSLEDMQIDPSRPNYLGEWPKEKIYSSLTEYANLVLLSKSEVAPLATCEALMAGLGLVVSESASANLDLSLPFIDVIPEAWINDKPHIEAVIKRNQAISVRMRRQIRQYAESQFDLKVLVEEYLNNIDRFVKNAGNVTLA